jgi:hypothetical protein
VLAALNLAFALAERPVPVAADDGHETATTDVRALVARIDAALGADGRLL